MPLYACPNCGSTVSSAAGPAPGACPSCCALLRLAVDGPFAALRPAFPAALRMQIDTGPDAPAAARHALRDLRAELGESRFRLCELLVSELVTNVVRHVAADAALDTVTDMRVRMYRDRVRVEVRDAGPGFDARPRTEDQDPGSGWGLHLVDELADDWGVDRGLENCVWFEVGRTPLASGMHAAAHA
jgi:anti-sigma regulatory factor (Ser/Thr protein kinase)